MLFDQLADSVQLFPAEAAAAFDADGIEPEFRFAIVAFDMDMRWLASIAGIEEKPQRAYSKDSRHANMLHRPRREGNVFNPTAVQTNDLRLMFRLEVHPSSSLSSATAH